MAVESSTFCILPWVHQYVSERGRFFPCAFSTESGVALRDIQGQFYELKDPGAAEGAWNSAGMRELRQEFLAGKEPASCARCFRLEKLQIQSLREVSNRHWGHLANELVPQTAADGALSRDVYSLDLRFGNYCNLRCRMCSPESSVKMIKEFQELHTGIPSDYFQVLQNLDWFRSPELQGVLLKEAASLRELHFAGGEPFLIPEVREFIGKLVASGESKHITLTFNTNLTVLPEEIYRYWPEFERVKVFVSLDGLGPVNDYIRFPSKFAQIEKNLQYLDENFERLHCAVVCFHTTVQMLNILSLDKFIQHFVGRYKNFIPFPILSPLHWPEPLAITVLSSKSKVMIERRLRLVQKTDLAYWQSIESRCDYSDGAARFFKSIDGIITLMNSEDGSHLFTDFQATTKFFDHSRQQNLADLFPELV